MIAVLFARHDSIYKSIPGCDVWDKDRNALNWPGGCQVIAHPPCRAWGRLRHLAKPSEGEKELALFALAQVRKWGGVLEHPITSGLWNLEHMPKFGWCDSFGGWILTLPQFWFGHRAEKWTGLYICGIDGLHIPSVPLQLGYAPRVIASSHKRQAGRFRLEVTKREREATPEPFAHWLIDLASRCGGQTERRLA